MNNLHKRKIALLLTTLALLAHVTTALGQGGSQYALVASTVGSGGTAGGGRYGLTGSAGQPVAGTISGGGYTVYGGFLGDGPPPSRQLYLPVIGR